jgi:hypothetical protein
MVRSLWRRTLVAMLASTGLVLGQHSLSPRARAADVEKIITVQEVGKGGQKCKVMKSWIQADGTQAYQVQSLDSGEVMTIVESQTTGVPMDSLPAPASGSRVRAVATRIFHWGRNGAAPAGTPMPPEMEIVQSTPMGTSPTLVTQTVPPPMAGQTVVTPLKPVPPPTIVTSPTIVTQTPSSSSRTWPPAFAGQPPVEGGKPATTNLYSEWNAKVPSGKLPDSASVVASKPVVEKAAPTDWHQSWGKPDASKTPEVKIETVKKEAPKTEPKFDKIDGKSDKSKVTQAKATLPDADVKKPDPLKNPDTYTRKGEEKDKPKSDMLPAAAATASVPPPPRPYTPDSTAPAPAGGPSMVGAQSVVSSGGTQYVPVPIVTVPDYRHPPQPPQGNVPQAPQLNLQVNGNAFAQPVSVAPPPESSAQQINAFSSMPASQPQQAPSAPPLNAFGNAPTSPLPPMGQPMMPPGYGPAMQRTMLPPAPYTPLPSAGFQQPYQQPPGVPMTPAGYPMPAPQMPAPQMPAPPAISPVSYQAGMANRPAPVAPASYAPSSDPAAAQLIQQLRDSFLPSERESAALRLSKLDWKTNEPVVHALLTAACQDPAATVRAGCVRSLAKMKCNTMPVVSAIQSLKTDSDARVQQEAEQALATLAPGLSASQGKSAPSSIVPASASVPAKN